MKEAGLKRLQTASNCTAFWKRPNYGDTKIRGCQEKGWEGCPGGAVLEQTHLYDTTMVSLSLYTSWYHTSSHVHLDTQAVQHQE